MRQRMRMRRLLAAAMAVGALGVPAAVQAQRPVKVGAQVRLRAPWLPDSVIVGAVESTDDDSVVVREARSSVPIRYAWSEVRSAEVRVGESAAEALGATLALAGAVSGAAIYLKWCRDDPRGCEEDRRESSADTSSNLGTAGMLVIGGALTGALLGYGVAYPHWSTARVPMRVTVAPLSREAFVVAVSITVKW